MNQTTDFMLIVHTEAKR